MSLTVLTFLLALFFTKCKAYAGQAELEKASTPFLPFPSTTQLTDAEVNRILTQSTIEAVA